MRKYPADTPGYSEKTELDLRMERIEGIHHVGGKKRDYDKLSLRFNPEWVKLQRRRNELQIKLNEVAIHLPVVDESLKKVSMM
jgi:hypothetical protein